ncbi:hypothetical protein ACHAWF_015680, partial [Thalassiosira exigua]
KERSRNDGSGLDCVRPRQGYHYPNKIDCLEIDSADRLESIQEKYSTTGSTTRLYYEGHELPLNSSIGSHNFRDFAILECCRSPALSAALSACLKDLDEIKQLPVHERRRESLISILQTPPYVSNDPSHDLWREKSWSDEKVKSRIINLATIKAVLQRQDRYHLHDLPQCNDCQSLFDALENHKVWSGGGRVQSKRNFFRQQAHIFKPEKNDGQPTTNWVLLEEKLNIQQKIRSEFGEQATVGEDWLEEFVRIQDARHETSQTRGRQSNDRNGADSHLSYLASTPPRRTNTPPRQRHSNGTPRKTYTPQYASGPFAILATLHLAMHSKHQQSRGRRLLTLTEEQLKRMAQPMCRSNLYDKGRIRGRNAFACMDGLIEKSLVRKEIIRNRDTAGEIEKWGLLSDGETLAEACAEFDRAVKDVIPVCQIGGKVPGGMPADLTICLDSREDVHLQNRMIWGCGDEDIPFIQKELPAGDYIFLDRSNGNESVMPLVVERKSWSDLADSCLGKGRARHRLDCVKLGDSSECPGNCQLCKMNCCGCTQIMFIIEGERCHGRDSAHRTAKKCTAGQCCSACKILNERHGGITQDVLENVLHRLQTEHGCMVHYTNCYNETIQSLFDIRSLLMNQRCFSGKSLLYDFYASNARRAGTNMIVDLRTKPTSVQELNVEAILASAASREWNLDLIRDLVGMRNLDRSSSNTPHKSSQQQTSGCSSSSGRNEKIGPNKDVIELTDLTSMKKLGQSGGATIAQKSTQQQTKIGRSSNTNETIDLNKDVIGLKDSLDESGTGGRQHSSRPTKRQRNDLICLDSGSDTEGGHIASNIRGGGNPFSLSSDDDEMNDCARKEKGKDGDESSDDDQYPSHSRFEARRRKLFEMSYDDDTDSDISIGLDSARRRKMAKKRKSRGRRSSPKKSISSNKRRRIAAKSPSTLSVARKLHQDLDVCLLSSSEEERNEPSSLQTGSVSSITTSVKRRRNFNDDVIVHSGGNDCTLLLLHGWDDYQRQFNKQLESVWKEICSSSIANEVTHDLYNKSTSRLKELIEDTSHLFVQRRTLVRFVLWLQAYASVPVRSVQKMSYADEIKQLVGQGGAKSPPMDTLASQSGHPQYQASYSTPAISNAQKSNDTNRDRIPHRGQNSSLTDDRKRPASTNSDSALVREARLKRFGGPNNLAPIDKNGKGHSKWSCPRCTLENTSFDEKCSACGGDPPTTRQLPINRTSDNWSCSSCTLDNKASESSCSICGAPRPTASTKSPAICLSSVYDIDQPASMNSGCISSSKAELTRRTVRCGACGNEGHNRSNANEDNCPAYFDEKEVERRARLKQKRDEKIAQENEKIKAIEEEAENADRMQAELARQIEELQRNKERAEEFRKEELKRRKANVKRWERQNMG